MSIRKVTHFWRKSHFLETCFPILSLHQLRGMLASLFHVRLHSWPILMFARCIDTNCQGENVLLIVHYDLVDKGRRKWDIKHGEGGKKKGREGRRKEGRVRLCQFYN